MLYTAQNGFKSLAAEKGCHMRFRVLNGKSPVCQPDQSVFVGTFFPYTLVKHPVS